MQEKEEILKLDVVSKNYISEDGLSRLDVLSKVSLAVRKGDSISIAGPSGSGKSTLLNIMGILDRPSSGSVLLNGVDASLLSDDDVSSARNKKIGFVFQMHHLLPQCTVIENVLIPVLPSGKSAYEASYSRAEQLLKKVGLMNRINNRPSELSGGEQLRTALVRALINEPELLLADEPTGSLDNKTAREISELIVSLNRDRQCALVVVTHSQELAGMMDTRFELKDGQLKRI